MVEIILQNERDKRGLLYLQQVRGDKSIKWALGQLEGKRYAYISNIAKILKVELPENTDLLPLLEEHVVKGVALDSKIDDLYKAIGRKRFK